MLPSGLQPPLLWLLLWMPILGLSSPLSLGEMITSPAHEDWPTLYNRVLNRVARNTTEKNPKTSGGFKYDITPVRMVDINNGELGDLRVLQGKEKKLNKKNRREKNWQEEVALLQKREYGRRALVY